MKTFKFLLLFNLFFYAGILFAISVASLLIYNIGFDSYKTLIINFHNILPIILLVLNMLLVLIKTIESMLKWSSLYIKYIITSRKKRIGYISSDEIFFSNSL